MNTADTALIFGIDIGGTNTKFGFVDPNGKILAKGRLKTEDYPDIRAFVSALHAQFLSMKNSLPATPAVLAVGIGAANANYFTGHIEHAPNLPWKGVVPLKELTEEIFGLPCTVTNDANAAAAGEMHFGVARGMQHFILITLGTGVGSGIVIDGKILYGKDGFAGELGHTMVKMGGRRHWSTGLEGTLEAYASATGMAITALKLRAENPASLLNQYREEDLSSQIVHQCAEAGDQTAIEVFRYTGELLGRALANFIMFSSPEAIILFGGATKAGPYLLSPTQEFMESSLLPVFRGKTKLLLSNLTEADAAILGAAGLALSDAAQHKSF